LFPNLVGDVADIVAAAALDRALSARLPELTVEVLKVAGDGPVRKNAAVVLARMAKHEPVGVRCTETSVVHVVTADGLS
jgi:hypothetical protein